MTDEDVILFSYSQTYRLRDRYPSGRDKYGRKFKQDETNVYEDFFLVKKKEGQSHIRYCDVIDELIKSSLEPTGDHRYMENIGLALDAKYPSSVPVCASFWGS